LERELRAAIGTEDIQPFFQPLVDLKTKKVVGFEALARWTHKERGNIPPDRFIPIAEDSGLIHALSDQLLRQACGAARTWPENVTLSFNISPVQLTDRTLGLRVLSILDETGLPPTRLEVEITESALVRDIEAAKEVLGSLSDAGVRIALVHFGTGYSSLYHRRNFKIDTIKIDRDFVERMVVERESAEIVSALVGLGRGLGMTSASYQLQRTRVWSTSCLTSFSGRRAGLRAHGRRTSCCPSTSLPFRGDQHSHHEHRRQSVPE
jgi:EAL domain-containing protein (putative c-di-GMP-specific phosphodiesterase class I)